MHRDLKPANIMLGGVPADLYDREVAQQYGTAKIADFGLSKSLALRHAASFHSHRHVKHVYRVWAVGMRALPGCLNMVAVHCALALDASALNDAASSIVA